MKWFKFYGQDWLTDLKVMKMSMEDRLCFITLLCLASSADKKGVVKNCDEESLIRLSNIPNESINGYNPYEKARGCLKRYEALLSVTLQGNGDVTVLHFDARQQQNLSPSEKQKNYRERLKTKTNSGNERYPYQSNERYPRIDKNRIDKNRTNTISEGFNKFWEIYPKKIGKSTAMKSWDKLNPNEVLVPKIIESITNHINSEQWKKERGQFIPNPSTFLNQERWEDEIKVIKPMEHLKA